MKEVYGETIFRVYFSFAHLASLLINESAVSRSWIRPGNSDLVTLDDRPQAIEVDADRLALDTRHDEQHSGWPGSARFG